MTLSHGSPLPLEIEPQQVQALQDSGQSFLFLDCREPDEYELTSIPGTMLLPMSELRERVEELAAYRDSHIVVHCHHGRRSLSVTQALRQAGFSQVQSMSGGIDQWSLEIDPSVPRY